MGGAERNARRKRQARYAPGQKPAVAQHSTGNRRNVVIGVVVVLLLLGAVIGGVLWTNNTKNATKGEDIKAKTPTSAPLKAAANGAVAERMTYPSRRDGAVVAVGQDDAKVTIDAYEDFLCPACGAFEDEYGDDIQQRLNDGTVRVRYHMLPLLNDRSDPPGYSLDSANAGLCAADAGKFPAFHLSLYQAQPEEGARGWDKAQLTKLGKDLGITSSTFASCVHDGQYDKIVQEGFEKVRNTDYLQQDFDGRRGFATPTIAVGRKVIDKSDPHWLDTVVGSTN